jgi:hypothetical protein
MAGRWRIEGEGGVWLVRGDARAAALALGGEALGRDAAAARVDAWFPTGWGQEAAGTLAAIGMALEGVFPGDGAPNAEWLKGTLRRALRDGRVTAVRVRVETPPGYTTPESEPRPVAAPVTETAWVEFIVIEDGTNRPIPGVKLTIKLPDGSEGEHTTNEDGAVAFDPVRPGMCVVSTDLVDLRLERAVEVVGRGASAGPVMTDDDPTKKGTARPRIAVVIRHRVRTGETLDGLANAHDLTWQDLARFNFGTEDPKRVNQLLRSQVGCRHKTADWKNYVFDDSDSPGVVYIPKALRLGGMGTGQAHVLRVLPVKRPPTPYLFSY